MGKLKDSIKEDLASAQTMLSGQLQHNNSSRTERQ